MTGLFPLGACQFIHKKYMVNRKNLLKCQPFTPARARNFLSD